MNCAFEAFLSSSPPSNKLLDMVQGSAMCQISETIKREDWHLDLRRRGAQDLLEFSVGKDVDEGVPGE